jgi:hypothetical protein
MGRCVHFDRYFALNSPICSAFWSIQCRRQPLGFSPRQPWPAREIDTKIYSKIVSLFVIVCMFCFACPATALEEGRWGHHFKEGEQSESIFLQSPSNAKTPIRARIWAIGGVADIWQAKRPRKRSIFARTLSSINCVQWKWYEQALWGSQGKSRQLSAEVICHHLVQNMLTLRETNRQKTAKQGVDYSKIDTDFILYNHNFLLLVPDSDRFYGKFSHVLGPWVNFSRWRLAVVMKGEAV